MPSFTWTRPSTSDEDGHALWVRTCAVLLDSGVAAKVTVLSRDWQRPQVSKVRLSYPDQKSPPGITPKELHRAVTDLRLPDLLRLQDGELDHWLRRHPQSLNGVVVRTVQGSPRTGRKARSDEDLLDFALLFVAALEQTSRRPYRLLKEDLGKDGKLLASAPSWLCYSTERTLRKFAKQCEERSLLTKAEPGKAHRELTDYARQLHTDRGG